MIIKTPALSCKDVNVFSALFKAQLPDTLAEIRRAVPDWSAVHVHREVTAPRPGAPTSEEMRDALLAALKPLAMLHDPIHTLTAPSTSPFTIATFVPDQVKPMFAPGYENFKFIYYTEARALLKELFDRAVGGIPEGNVGMADVLVKGELKGSAVLEGWTGTIAIPTYKRTVEALVNRKGRVMFWDGAFGYETDGGTFFDMSDRILGMFSPKDDRLYFDATNFSWFVVLYRGGQLRVGLLV